MEQENLRKFSDQHICVDGKERASVQLRELQTLWFNTGTLCNLACADCYIESSPKNDRLEYLSFTEMSEYLIELIEGNYDTQEIGFTGGEPFLNPEIIEMLNKSLELNFRVLVLTNAMKPMIKRAVQLKKLKEKNPQLNKLELESSIDVFSKTVSDALISGKNVEIRGLGRWYLRKLKENFNARNPSTNELIYKPERVKVRFRSSKKLNKRINE